MLLFDCNVSLVRVALSIAPTSLIEVIHIKERLFLVFEFLDYDLKQYLISLQNEYLSEKLLQVRPSGSLSLWRP